MGSELEEILRQNTKKNVFPEEIESSLRKQGIDKNRFLLMDLDKFRDNLANTLLYFCLDFDDFTSKEFNLAIGTLFLEQSQGAFSEGGLDFFETRRTKAYYLKSSNGGLTAEVREPKQGAKRSPENKMGILDCVYEINSEINQICIAFNGNPRPDRITEKKIPKTLEALELLYPRAQTAILAILPKEKLVTQLRNPRKIFAVVKNHPNVYFAMHDIPKAKIDPAIKAIEKQRKKILNLRQSSPTEKDYAYMVKPIRRAHMGPYRAIIFRAMKTFVEELRKYKQAFELEDTIYSHNNKVDYKKIMNIIPNELLGKQNMELFLNEIFLKPVKSIAYHLQQKFAEDKQIEATEICQRVNEALDNILAFPVAESYEPYKVMNRDNFPKDMAIPYIHILAKHVLKFDDFSLEAFTNHMRQFEDKISQPMANQDAWYHTFFLWIPTKTLCGEKCSF